VMAGRLDGRAGVVTGSASGLGRETVIALAAEGARLVCLDRDGDRGRAVVEEAVAAGGTAVFHQGDITVEQDIADAVARCRGEFGGFDIMHNNAGIQLIAPLHETTPEQWQQVVDINLRGTFWGCKHAALAMLETGGGSIVNTASISSFMGDPLLPVYTMSKTGILGLTRSVGIEYGGDNIRCNCVCPGDMDTPMIQDYFDAQGDPAEARRAVEAAYPQMGIAHPREVAMAVLFLVSDDSSFINATSIVVDGGVTAIPY
jgi:NAD(P)-dependent dehydrogenase (short-subunit alcohol dehydrogenase family)